MTLVDVFHGFRTADQATDYLERVRWRSRPVCPYCAAAAVCRHASGDRASHRWQCQNCHRAFSAMVGTIFHRTHIPLRTWFLLLVLMLSTDKPMTASKIARDLDMRRPTVSSMMRRVRMVMATDPQQAELLRELVKADKAS